MKIAVLGAGTWGFCLAALLASKGYDVHVWTRDPEECKRLNETRVHPKLAMSPFEGPLTISTNLQSTLQSADMVVESVTSAGIRPVFEEVRSLGVLNCPIVCSSKGIESGTGLLLTEIVAEIMGKKELVGCLSGPSHAEEVIRGVPTSVVCSSYGKKTMQTISEVFTTDTFRVYPNADMLGVSFGGAAKNVIAIACGISDGLGFGDNSKAALMTRGLHEIRKLAVAKGCKAETMNGLAGMGDLCVTCMSVHSRNYRFGKLIAEGKSMHLAQEEIGMVVEGVFACKSTFEMSLKLGTSAPITENVYRILYEGMRPVDAVRALMEREIKEEHL